MSDPHPSWIELLRDIEAIVGRPVEWETFARVFRTVAKERGLEPGQLEERSDEIGTALGDALTRELNAS